MFGAGMVGHGVCFFTVLFYAHLDERSAKNSQEARHLLSQISPFDWHPINHPKYSFVPAPRHNDTSVWIWVFATLFNSTSHICDLHHRDGVRAAGAREHHRLQIPILVTHHPDLKIRY